MNLASKDLAERSIPALHYTVDLAYLPDTVSIGDRGIIIDHEFNPPLYIEARVLEIQTSDTDPSANYVLIGNVIELFPEDKSEILKLQQGLEDTRNEVMDELRKGQPLTFSIESSSGELFSQETTLGMRVDKGANIVTDRFDRFVWERISSDNAKDNAFNQILTETGQTTSYISVREIDLVDEQSTFRCSVYTGDTLAGSASITIKIAKAGKSAYELAVENGFMGSLLDWIQSLKGSDGSDGIRGQDGEDGRASYTHIAYANSSDGRVDFTRAKHTDKEYTYFGMYVDDKEADSQNPADYNWLYFRGKTTYLFVAYADSADGTVNFSINDSLNKKFMGTYTSTEVEQSTDPFMYAWLETAGFAEENAKNYADELAQWNEDQLNQVRQSLQDYTFSLDGKTTIYRGTHAPIGMKENDIWYRPHPELENETQLVIYNGELWEIIADTSGISLLTEQMDTVKQETQGARDRANEAYTKAETAENALIDKVSKDDYESTISQIEDNINLRVGKGDIVNQINISDEDILIDSSKIHLSGDTTVDGSFKVTGDMIAGTISADKLQGGTINGSKMNIVDINADSITSGKLVIHEDFGIWSRGELRKILYGIDLAKDKRIALHTSHLMDYGCAIYWIEGEDGIHRLEVEVHVEDDIIQVKPEDVLWYERRSESRSDTITHDEWIENVYQIGTGTSLTLTSDILSRKNVIIVDWIKGKKTNIMEVGE